MSSVSRNIDRLDVTFDDASLVANAGMLLPLTLAKRLDVAAVVDRLVRLGHGGQQPSRKVLTLVTTLLCGGSHIEHADMLRAGGMQSVLPFQVMAPSTLGTFLRSFTHGHVRQLESAQEELLRRAWLLDTGPGSSLVVDIDSTVCNVFGKKKQGAAYGYTKHLGYHPLLAIRADTGEILHTRMRKGSSQRGAKHFVVETINRLQRCGVTGRVTLRADSGFYSHQLIDECTKRGVHFSITVNANKAVRTAVAAIEESTWTPIDYTDSGRAEVAETTYSVDKGHDHRPHRYRLVVRRTQLDDPNALVLFPGWRYHAFVTDLDGDAVEVDAFHRRHATVELAIRDLKESSGMAHCPSGRFNANAAWMHCAALAHNLVRWTMRLGKVHPPESLTVARSWRQRLFATPGRVVNRSGRPTLRFPRHWPWRDCFIEALQTLRRLQPMPTG